MADSKRRELEFEHIVNGFDKRYFFSEGSFEPKREDQVIRVRERQPYEFLTRITCYVNVVCYSY